MKRLLSLSLSLVVLLSSDLQAQHVDVWNGQMLRFLTFKIVNDSSVALTYGRPGYVGTVDVPETIQYEGKTYVVRFINHYVLDGARVVNFPRTIETIGEFGVGSRIEMMRFQAPPLRVIGDYWDILPAFFNPIVPKKIGEYEIEKEIEEGILLAKDDSGKVGLLDYNGNVLVPFIYDGYGSTAGNNYGGYNRRERLGLNGWYNVFSFRKGLKWGVVDLKNTVLLPFKFEQSYDVSWEKAQKYSLRKYKRIRREVDSLYECQINVAYLMYCAEESVRREEKRQRELARQDSIRRVAEEKRRVAEEKRRRELAHQDSIAPVLAKGSNGLWGIVEKKTRKKITPYQYENVKPVQETGWGLSDTLFCIVQKKGKKGVFSIKQRKECIQPVFDDIFALSMSAGVCPYLVLSKGGKCGIGTWYERINGYFIPLDSMFFVCPVSLDSITDLKDFAVLHKGGKSGLLYKKSGKIQTCVYDAVVWEGYENTALLWVLKSGKWGVVDTEGFRLACDYDAVLPMRISTKENGLLLLLSDEKWGLYGKNGSLLSCDYDYIGLADAATISSPLFYISKNDKWGLYGKNGIVLPCKYDYISDFENGKAEVLYKGFGGTVSHDGKFVEGIVERLFNKAYNMDDSRVQDKLNLYFTAERLDKELNEGYLGSIYCNVGVIMQNVGDRESALSYYNLSSSYGCEQGKKNYKSLRSEIRWENASRIMDAITNAMGEVSQSMSQYNYGTGVYNYGDYGSSSSGSYNTGSSGSNGGNYQAQYAMWERRAKSNYESLTATGLRGKYEDGSDSGNGISRTKGSNYVLQQKYLREAQSEMRKIRQEAARAGVHISQSKWETAQVSLSL